MEKLNIDININYINRIVIILKLKTWQSRWAKGNKE